MRFDTKLLWQLYPILIPKELDKLSSCNQIRTLVIFWHEFYFQHDCIQETCFLLISLVCIYDSCMHLPESVNSGGIARLFLWNFLMVILWNVSNSTLNMSFQIELIHSKSDQQCSIYSYPIVCSLSIWLKYIIAQLANQSGLKFQSTRVIHFPKLTDLSPVRL